MNEAAVRRDLVRYSQAMHAAGFVANHDGNLSARISDDRIVCTPTSFSKADIERDTLLVTDGTGRKVAGRFRPFSELALHCAVYRGRPEAHAVVHAHPPMASAFGVAGQPVPHPFMPEAVVSLGAEIPTVPLAAPGPAAVEALKPYIRRCDAVLIAGNGVLAWGPDLETAWLRLELVEHICRIAHAALPLGGPARLPAEMVSALSAKRRKGGLAAPEEGLAPLSGGTGTADAATDDPASRATRRALAGIPNADPRLAAQIAAEIARSLRR